MARGGKDGVLMFVVAGGVLHVAISDTIWGMAMCFERTSVYITMDGVLTSRKDDVCR